jgi:hypothetical protein
MITMQSDPHVLEAILLLILCVLLSASNLLFTLDGVSPYLQREISHPPVLGLPPYPHYSHLLNPRLIDALQFRREVNTLGPDLHGELETLSVII